jgi:Protein of unknown function (DUF1573)
MRIPIVILVAAIIGTLVGGAIAYVEVTRSAAVVPLLPRTAGKLSTGQSAPAVEKVPRVQIDEPHFQFGSMQRGTSKSHRFEVKNIGGAPLTLTVGQTSCKCTLGEVDGKPIPPGASTHVLLEWKALTDNGPFRQTATLLTNDPRQSQVELTIEGQITEVTNVSPPDFMFDKITSGESKSADVFVMAMLEDDLQVSEAKITDPEIADKFDVWIEPVEHDKLPNPAAKQGVKITVTAKPGLPVGRINQWLSLRTNLADVPTLDIPLVGRVVGDISVHGIDWNEELGVLALGKVKAAEGRVGRVNIVVRGTGATNVKLHSDSVDPAELQVKVGEPKKLSATLVHIPVEIEVPAGTRPMVRLGTAQGDEARIVLKTTHPQIKELVLGVRFSVER